MFEQTGCDEGQSCVIADSFADGGVIGACAPAASGEIQPGEACEPSDQTYWGNCEASSLCTSFAEGDPTECVSFCHTENLDVCGENQVCAADLFDGLPGLGLCVGQCNPIGEGAEGCAENQVCNLTFLGLNAEGGEQAAGNCGPKAETTVATGEQCEVDEETGDSNCNSGHICAQTAQNAPPVCVKLCDADAEPTGCPDGTACQAVFEASDRFGACL
jgi:hypothetical protein